MLSKKHLKDICLYETSEPSKCRYLTYDADSDSFLCLKHTGYAKLVDETLANHDLRGDEPLGDNCQGYLYLKNIEQGYDKD